jgi:hypothetical protein
MNHVEQVTEAKLPTTHLFREHNGIFNQLVFLIGGLEVWHGIHKGCLINASSASFSNKYL